MPKVTVDGVEIEVPQGATVLQACELAGKERQNHRDEEGGGKQCRQMRLEEVRVLQLIRRELDLDTLTVAAIGRAAKARLRTLT